MCAVAAMIAAIMCPAVTAVPFPSIGATAAAVDVSVSPSLIQAELGSFLWIAQTEVGAVTVRNSGYATVTVTMQFNDAVHDMWGAVTAAQSNRAAAVLTAEPRFLVLMPGASGIIRIRADSSVALEKKLGAAAVLSVTACPAVAGAASAATAATAAAAAGAAAGARVDVTVLVRPAGARRGQGASPWLTVEGLGLSLGSGEAWMDVHNAGPFYAWTSGGIEVRRGSSRVQAPVPESLVLPGCTRRLALTGLGGVSLSEGRHEVVVRLPGEEATTSVLNVTKQASPDRP